MKSIRTAFAPTQPTKRAARRGTIALAALLLAWLLPATPSLAGTYRVDSCRIPTGASAGSPAPLEVAEGSAAAPGEWNRISSGAGQSTDRCSDGGALTADLPAGAEHGTGDAMTLQFTAPPDETITDANLWRAGDADGGNGYLLWLATPTNVNSSEVLTSATAFGGCAFSDGCESGVGDQSEPLAAHNKIAVPAEDLGGTHLYVSVSCALETCPGDASDAKGYAVVAYLYAAEMELEETAAPSVSGVGGELATASTLSGEASLEFHAEDPGSGVYQAIVEVDGQQTQRFVIDEAEGRCAPVGEGDGTPLTFLRPQPCPKALTGHVSLDTASLTDGEHALRVSVTDAAGNSTPVLEREIDVDNGGSTGEAGGEAGEPGSESAQDEQPGQAGSGQPGSGEPGSGEPGGGQTSAGQLPAPSEAQPGQETLGAVTATGDDALASPPATALATSAANGDPASATARLAAHWVVSGKARSSRVRRRKQSASQITIRYGHSATIAGTLTTAAGTPIAGAALHASVRPAYGGASSEPLKATRTGRHGRFTLKLGKHVSSRTVELSYASSIGGTPVVSTALRLRVSAAVRLRVSPRRTAAGETIRLSGRVLGAPIPHGGKQVVLEARSAGTRWLQFKVLHTSGHGSFAATHRFRLPGPIRYSFRAVCPAEADFPFRTGASRVVSVWER